MAVYSPVEVPTLSMVSQLVQGDIQHLGRSIVSLYSLSMSVKGTVISFKVGDRSFNGILTFQDWRDINLDECPVEYLLGLRKDAEVDDEIEGVNEVLNDTGAEFASFVGYEIPKLIPPDSSNRGIFSSMGHIDYFDDPQWIEILIPAVVCISLARPDWYNNHNDWVIDPEIREAVDSLQIRVIEW